MQLRTLRLRTLINIMDYNSVVFQKNKRSLIFTNKKISIKIKNTYHYYATRSKLNIQIYSQQKMLETLSPHHSRIHSAACIQCNLKLIKVPPIL